MVLQKLSKIQWTKNYNSMKTEVNMESLEGMSFADYKKALKKDKKLLKKAKGIMFVNDLTTEWEHKFDAFKNNTAKHKELYKDWIQKKDGVDDQTLINEITIIYCTNPWHTKINV